jgi:hypothetical protein
MGDKIEGTGGPAARGTLQGLSDRAGVADALGRPALRLLTQDAGFMTETRGREGFVRLRLQGGLTPDVVSGLKEALATESLEGVPRGLERANLGALLEALGGIPLGYENGAGEYVSLGVLTLGGALAGNAQSRIDGDSAAIAREMDMDWSMALDPTELTVRGEAKGGGYARVDLGYQAPAITWGDHALTLGAEGHLLATLPGAMRSARGHGRYQRDAVSGRLDSRVELTENDQAVGGGFDLAAAYRFRRGGYGLTLDVRALNISGSLPGTEQVGRIDDNGAFVLGDKSARDVFHLHFPRLLAGGARVSLPSGTDLSLVSGTALGDDFHAPGDVVMAGGAVGQQVGPVYLDALALSSDVAAEEVTVGAGITLGSPGAGVRLGGGLSLAGSKVDGGVFQLSGNW